MMTLGSSRRTWEVRSLSNYGRGRGGPRRSSLAVDVVEAVAARVALDVALDVGIRWLGRTRLG